MDIVNLLIQLVSGVFGGNAAGAALKEKSLGNIGNSIVGLLGGGASAFIMQLIEGASAAGIHNFDIKTIITSVVSGGVGGGVLTGIIGFLKTMLKK